MGNWVKTTSIGKGALNESVSGWAVREVISREIQIPLFDFENAPLAILGKYEQKHSSRGLKGQAGTECGSPNG